MNEMPDNWGRVTEGIKKRIVRFIHDMQLNAGDPLPRYKELGKLFNCGNTSISRAMNLLAAEGVVEIRSHVGVFVKRPDTRSVFGRNIGVLRVSARRSPFMAFLHYFISIELVSHGCSAIYFGYDDDVSNEDMHRRLDYSLARGNIQGILDTTRQPDEVYDKFKRLNVPYIFMGSEYLEQLPGVGLGFDDFLRDAATTLFLSGARRLALVYSKVYATFRFEAAFLDSLPARAQGIVYDRVNNFSDGYKLAVSLLSRPQEERPDAIIFLDDNTANAFTAGLVQNSADYRPLIAATILRQQPLLFAIQPTVLYQTDIEQLARVGVRRLLAEIRGERREQTVKLPLTPIEKVEDYPVLGWRDDES